MIKKPNFLIVGAARSGTTSLYYYLKQHPEISFPKLKEPKYFSSINRTFPQKGPGDKNIDKYIIKDKEEYFKLFEYLNTFRIGEASPDYLFYHLYTSKEIYNELGDIPIIIILRNPIQRAYSAYSYQKRDSREKLSFRSALDKEEERLANNYDFMWAYKNYGFYYEKVKSFLNKFSNVKILLTENLQSDTNKILKETFEFLDVDSSYSPRTDIIHNASGNPSNFLTKFVLNRESTISTLTRELLKKIIPRQILENYSSQHIKKSNISKEDYIYLESIFKDDILKLNRITSQDLDQLWKIK